MAIISSPGAPNANVEVSVTPSATRVIQYDSNGVAVPPAPRFIGSYYWTLPFFNWAASDPAGSNVYAIAMGTTNRRAIIRSIDLYISTPSNTVQTMEFLLFRSYLSAPSAGATVWIASYPGKRNSYPTPDMQVAAGGSTLTFPGTLDPYPFASLTVPRAGSGKKNPRHVIKFHRHNESFDYFELKSWEGIVIQIGPGQSAAAVDKLQGQIEWDEIEDV